MRFAWVMSLLLVSSSGCRALVELVESDDSTRGDGGVVDGIDGGFGIDADTTCDGWSFTPAFFDPCAIPAPAGGLNLGAGMWTYDTGTGTLTAPNLNETTPASALLTPGGGPEVRVVSVDWFELGPGAELRVYGMRPLLLVSWADVTVSGNLSADGFGGVPAAGANPSACAESPATIGGSNAGEGAGGGGGGGFADPGGDGGSGDATLAAAGTGGGAASAPIGLRGGCPGAAGGNTMAGSGGAAGGALHLTARGAVHLGGVITANGGGGGPSTGARSGGGGGGSGGLIGLEGSSITIEASAVIAANGGGGGGGSDNNPATIGQDGQPSATPASGGAGEGMGDDGGDGGALASPPQPGNPARRGGGGGGGSAGFVRLTAEQSDVDQAAIISPAPG